MLKKKIQSNNKDVVVASMAKKLADLSTTETLGKNKKKKLKRSYLIYIVTFSVFIVLSIVPIMISQSKENSSETERSVSEKMNSPLVLLADAFKNDSISVDQYAFYLKDLLIRYDSLPVKYRTDYPVITTSDIYLSIVKVWMKLGNNTRISLINDLPDLNPQIERMKDSLGIR